jgi:CRISPR-associated protein Cas5t
MPALYLRVRAPFAAFRPLQAGAYRGTLPVIPPTAAHGLVLNLAGVESRDLSDPVTTRVRADVPPLRIAVANLAEPAVATLYQQLHGYPVGSSGKEHAARAHGAKYWIAPVRRELLVGLDVALAVESPDAELLARVMDGLSGKGAPSRYGLPFAGDNNFLVDRLEVLAKPPEARWYERLAEDEPPRSESCRLPVAIDRRNSSRTRLAIYAPSVRPHAPPSAAAWTWTPRSPEA